MTCTLDTTRHSLSREAPPGSFVEFSYENGEGYATHRRVRIIGYSHARNGHTYTRAYCFLRKEERTFRADRIREWKIPGITVNTGESVPEQKPSSAPIAWPQIDLTPAHEKPHPSQPVSATQLSRESEIITGKKKSRRWGERVKSFLWMAAFACVALFIFGPRVMNKGSSSPLPAYIPNRIPVVAPRLITPKTVKPQPAPSPPEQETRVDRFRQATGIRDPSLERIYASADGDRDGRLSWTELRNFQSGLQGRFQYLSNDLALRPDEFIQQGGGDCDDWALFTCGLLRYWGWEPYLGCFSPPGDTTKGHAVCLVRQREAPGSCQYYSIAEGCILESGSVPPGYYVPIDYDVVGGVSNAMGKNWKLAEVYVPEEVYGKNM